MLKKIITTFFGFGYLPIAQGTWGSFAAVGIFFILALFFANHILWITAILIILSAAIGIALGKWAINFFKSNDPKPFVLDEAAGMWISLIALPFNSTSTLFLITAVQFILFRIFDIIKPPPVRQSEKLPAGWGIVTDDLMAGIYANITGQLIFRIIFQV